MLGMILLAYFNSIPVNAQINETGSLRSFILGDEPAASYDNWISHTVEGQAVEGGYNVHCPFRLDPQTNGFGSFELITEDIPATRQLWRQVFGYLWSDEPTQAQALLDLNSIPYEVVYFEDTETGDTYRMLRELLNESYIDTGFYAGPDDDVTGSFDKGWGLFIINPQADAPWAHAQVVHVNDDYICVPLTTDLFLDGSLGALSIHGTGREVMWVEGQDYNNSRSLSDPSRNGDLPVQWFTEFFVDLIRSQDQRDLTIQLHSYDTESHGGEPTIQISGGSVDGYPNRPGRDISGMGYDWVNFAPTTVVPADYSIEGQAEVTVGNYFAVWRGYGLHHLESGIEISTNVPLSGYPDSPQMAACAQGVNRFEAFDRWVHVEFDELPYAVADAGYIEDNYYDGTIPPTESNWDAMLRYYESASDALIAYVNDVVNPQDIDPPTTPTDISVFYAADDFVELTWSGLSLDPNFAEYQMFYGTDAEIDTTNLLWSAANDGDLVGQNISFTQLTGLEFNQDYGFRLRGIDIFGQAGDLTETIRATTSEGDQPPLPFSLISPLEGDTCFTLDTTLVWESTTDPDLYDVPHYDVWVDTLLDLSTAWIPQGADSLADTTVDLSNLRNRVTYYWTVRATDRNTAGTWANETRSLVTWHTLPPAPFELASPIDRRTLWDAQSATLVWNSSFSQENPGAEISYIPIIADNGGFDNADTMYTTDTSYVVDNLQINTTYWWKVLAYDEADTTECEDVWKFFVWERLVPNFSLLAPDDGAWIDEDTVEVSWSVPEDITFSRRDNSDANKPLPYTQARLDILSEQMTHEPKGSSSHGGEGWAAIDNHGGPDDFGHVWIDNEEPGGPLYYWIEISESGTLSTVSDIDDGTETVMLPFPFTYYGDSYFAVVISSNGNIHFGEADNDYNHYTIPSEDGPAGIIAPWWMDLRPNVRGNIYYQASGNMFIVQWDDCRQYGHADWLYTFQVILYADGRIKFQYKSMTGGLADATIGIENLSEDDGLLVAFNAAYVADRIATMFTLDDWIYNVQWSAHPDFTDSISISTNENQYEIGDVIWQQMYYDEMDELPDDLPVYWRVQTTNLYGQTAWANPGEDGRNFLVYLQEDPSTFELSLPEDGATVETDTVTVSWLPATDPDPLDTLSYVVEWSDDANVFNPLNQAVVADTFFTITDLLTLLEPSFPNEIPSHDFRLFKRQRTNKADRSRSKAVSAESIEEIAETQPVVEDELDELPDNSTLYWRVRVQDQAGNTTWPDHGDTPWSFIVQVPEPPSAFNLLVPINSDTLNNEEISDLLFSWEDSVDPDPNEDVSYSINLQVEIGDLIDTTFSMDELEQSDLALNLLDHVLLDEWEDWWLVTWRINAISGTDTVACIEDFSFHVEPYLNILDQRFAGIPDEFSVASIYPNPFNPTTTVAIGLPATANLQVDVFNIVGQRVQTSKLDQVAAGYQSVVVDGQSFASGVYFVRAVIPGKLDEVRKIVLVR